MVEFPGDRGLHVVGVGGHVGDLPDHGLVPSFDDDAGPTAAGAGGPEERHVGALEDVLHELVHHPLQLLRLSRQRRIIHLHPFALEEHQVRWDLRPCVHLHDVPWHQLVRLQQHLLPVPPHRRLLRNLVLELGHDLPRLRLLLEVEDRCDDDDHYQATGQVQILPVALVHLDPIHHKAQQRPHNDHVVEEPGHGEEEPDEARELLPLCERVLPISS
mmetsp:Transcript_22779/g.21987  ORF Transcript_22779/g.21987 Transcript_22779/m.21987 type:complete len:216 (-) Transcript_22779:308-955(-)